MARLKAANNAITKLTVSITAADTSFTVEDAALFPDSPFRVTIDDEIMQVEAIDKLTNTFSAVQRGLEGTVAAPHNNGAEVANRWTAGYLETLATLEESQAMATTAESEAKTHAEAYADDVVAAHKADNTNPHSVTKANVGLGAVENYGIATQAEAQAGTSNVKYMTPLRVKEAISTLGARVASGVYNGTGSDGLIVTGFLPRFVMLVRRNSVTNNRIWVLVGATGGIIGTSVEVGGLTRASNGFNVSKDTGNTAGETYAWVAIG